MTNAAAAPSFLPVAIAAPILAVVGWVIVTGRSRVRVRVRAVAAWGVVPVGSIVFALAARRSGDVDRDGLVRDMPVAGELGVSDRPLTVGALTVEVRQSDATPALVALLVLEL